MTPVAAIVAPSTQVLNKGDHIVRRSFTLAAGSPTVAAREERPSGASIVVDKYGERGRIALECHQAEEDALPAVGGHKHGQCEAGRKRRSRSRGGGTVIAREEIGTDKGPAACQRKSRKEDGYARSTVRGRKSRCVA